MSGQSLTQYLQVCIFVFTLPNCRDFMIFFLKKRLLLPNQGDIQAQYLQMGNIGTFLPTNCDCTPLTAPLILPKIKKRNEKVN